MGKLISDYQKARQSFIKAIDMFPKDKREEVLFDKWSLKQLITHLSGWDNYIANSAKYLKYDQERPFYGSVDEYNAKSVAKGKDWSWIKAYNEFIKGGGRVIKECEKLDDGLWNTMLWINKSSTLEKFIKIQTKHYLHEHLPQVTKYIER